MWAYISLLVVKYLNLDITQTQPTNANCHPGSVKKYNPHFKCFMLPSSPIRKMPKHLPINKKIKDNKKVFECKDTPLSSVCTN